MLPLTRLTVAEFEYIPSLDPGSTRPPEREGHWQSQCEQGQWRKKAIRQAPRTFAEPEEGRKFTAVDIAVTGRGLLFRRLKSHRFILSFLIVKVLESRARRMRRR